MQIAKPSFFVAFHSAYEDGDATVCNIDLSLDGELLACPHHGIRRSDTEELAQYLFQEIDAGTVKIGTKPIPSISEIKLEKIVQIKDQANRRIIAKYPLWKQQNLISDLYAIDKKLADGQILASKDVALRSEIINAQTAITLIREKSDVLEVSLNTMTAEEMMDLSPSEDTHWI